MSDYYHCKDCVSMDLNDASMFDKSKRRCSEREEYYNPNDRACSKFKKDEIRTETSSSPCYLTTIICNILGMEDYSEVLECLRNFRDNYMLNHPETYPMLLEYDVVGPKIADALAHDQYKLSIAYSFYNSHIIPVTQNIQNQNFEEAIKKYEDMTNRLKNFYKIDTTINEKLDINIKTLGKARA